MNTRNAPHPLQTIVAQPRDPAIGRGTATLLAAGLAVLAATAAAGRYYWAGHDPHATVGPVGTIPAEIAPQVWIWSHDENAPQGFTNLAPPEIPLVALPHHAPLPRIAESYVASRAPVTASAAPAASDTVSVERRGTELARAEPTEIATADLPFSPVTQTAPQPGVMRPIVTASVPPVVPPRRPEATPDAVRAQVLFAPSEPTDSSGYETAAATQIETQTATARLPGLERSLRPRARPDSVVQMASLSTRLQTVTRSVAADPPAAASVTAAAVIDVPPQAAAGRDSCPATLTRAIPRRPSGAEGGQAAIARLAASAGSARDNAVAQAVIAGNLPDFLRGLVPVSFTGTGTDGRAVRITLCAMPDYLALGSDADFVRVPLGLPAASRIAERFDMVLPTTRMVDAIHAQASVRLRPSPMTPGAQMASTDYFLRHNATLEGQRQSARAPLGALVSGHKKDLVLSNRLESNPGRVAIYGWHQANGQPIQPLSTVHGASYADYSHGIRLISRTAFVNGRAVDLRDLLDDARYAGLISNEGPIASRLMLASLR